MFPALTAAAFVLATVSVVVWLGIVAGRRQGTVAAEWWIPLFAKSAAVTAGGAAVGCLATQYVSWRVVDAQIEQIVNRGAVVRTDRRLDHIAYEFDARRAGGVSRLHRYDFRIVWEAVAAFAAASGVVGGVIAIAIARMVITARNRRPAFAVLR